MKNNTIGVDVGGTNINFGLINQRGKVIDRSRLVTKSFSQNRSILITAICDSILQLIHKNNLKKKDIAGIGFGLPGLINPQKGIVNFLPNIPGWKNVPLKKMIQQRLKITTHIDNDVNVITLGEWRFGAGRGYENLLCMTLGTGVGAGLVLNNSLYKGEGFVAGELGHMPLNEKGPQCNCGGRACFERYVGNKPLVAKGRLMFRKKNIGLEEIHKLAAKGNSQALRFWEQVGVHIGNGLVGVINLLNLRLIIIGGGVSNNLRFMKPTIEKVIYARAMSVQKKMVKIVRAQLGDDAGLLGAHVLVKENKR